MSSEISSFTNKCRTCMKEGSEMLPMYDEQVISVINLPYKLVELTSIQIDKFDGLPSMLCRKCVYHIDALYNFKLQVQESDKKFRMMLENQKIKLIDESNEDNTMQVNESLELVNNMKFEHSADTFENTEVEIENKIVKEEQQDDFDTCQLVKENRDEEKSNLQLNDLYNFIQKASEDQTDIDFEKSRMPKEISKILESQDITILYIPNPTNEPITENMLASAQEYEEIDNTDNIFVPVVEILSKQENKETLSNTCVANQVKCSENANVTESNKRAYWKYKDDNIIQKKDKKIKCNENISTDEQSTKADDSDECDSDYYIDAKDNVLGSVNDAVTRIKEVKQDNGIEYQCTLCLQNFDQLTSALLHTVDNHVPSSGPFFCVVCEKDCESYRELRAHVKTHTGEFPYNCFICKKAYTKKRYLKRHMVCHSEFPRHRCAKCGRRFKTRSELESHATIHLQDVPFICNQCSRVFNHKGNYKRHLISHLDPQGLQLPKYPCKYCGKRFPNNRTLETHMRVHTGEKPFICELCKKSFSQKGNLLNHMKIHSNPRNYTCETCGKSFNQRATLKDHALLHTGEKPYVCNVCGKSFTVSAALRRHMFNHTGSKPFKCEICAMEFTGRYDLRRHMRVHENRPREKRRKNAASKTRNLFQEELKDSLSVEEDPLAITEEPDTETVLIEQVLLPQDFTQVVQQVESEKENEDTLFRL
ncbi:zinc finger protein 665-like [Linepithema humile]|uniref:zinc finger protein 665-like n=1 Tax=Linepithema humile TaxID=83485 RepID=UPI00351E67BA